MTGNNCKITCWLAALVAGWLVGLFFWVGAGWGFFWALIAGLIVCFLAGMFLPRFFCSEEQAHSDGSAASTNAPAASTAPSSAPKPAPEPAPEPAPAPEAAAPAGSDPVVKPSTELPGQNELAERKGSWTYEGDSVETSPDAAQYSASDTAAENIAEAPPQPEAEAAPASASAPATETAEFGMIKASTKLPGQEELAARKGTWTYQGEANETVQTADSAPASPSEGTQPQGLSAARPEGADNLKMIRGVGPKLEKLLNSMGFFHFDQIAGWTASDVAWVDENLVGFKGRVSRDTWVDQAIALAAGEETEFAKRAKIEGIYD